MQHAEAAKVNQSDSKKKYVAKDLEYKTGIATHSNRRLEAAQHGSAADVQHRSTGFCRHVGKLRLWTVLPLTAQRLCLPVCVQHDL